MDNIKNSTLIFVPGCKHLSFNLFYFWPFKTCSERLKWPLLLKWIQFFFFRPWPYTDSFLSDIQGLPIVISLSWTTALLIRCVCWKLQHLSFNPSSVFCPQLVKLCSGMIEAGKAYVSANKLFVNGIRDLSQQCKKDVMISVRFWNKASVLSITDFNLVLLASFVF